MRSAIIISKATIDTAANTPPTTAPTGLFWETVVATADPVVDVVKEELLVIILVLEDSELDEELCVEVVLDSDELDEAGVEIAIELLLGDIVTGEEEMRLVIKVDVTSGVLTKLLTSDGEENTLVKEGREEKKEEARTGEVVTISSDKEGDGLNRDDKGTVERFKEEDGVMDDSRARTDVIVFIRSIKLEMSNPPDPGSSLETFVLHPILAMEADQTRRANTERDISYAME